MAEPLSGRILHLQRLSTEDGPGIRTTVFFKGCPLRCAWCHNPESLSPQPQVQWLETRCIGCRTCLAACPHGCLDLTGQGMRIDRQRCTGCGICAEACPANAMELLGTAVTVKDLVKELVKDRTYYETSGGGVTASGGEPALQADFVAALLARLQGEGVATALDTCGLAPSQAWHKILPHVDLVLFDLKEIDPDQHRAHTGQSNERILEALLMVRDYITGQRPDTRLWIRTPLIPGATATAANLRGLGDFIAHHLDRLVERWELCAFNNLCRDKYRRLGMPWRFDETPLLSDQTLRALERQARRSGVDPAIVVATGPTRDGR
ncbi:MAG: glycyl-radical enzyme activating protein [Anaerolineae bacterium]|jgi:pyruvate formate lyase activating enzyme